MKLTRMVRNKLFALVLGGGMIFTVAGGCLPNNFFADLAGNAIQGAVDIVIADVVGNILEQSAGG